MHLFDKLSDFLNTQKFRFGFFIFVIFGMFAVLVSGLVELQLTDTDYYAQKAESGRTKTITLKGKRGNIMDAESVILANDEYIFNVTFYKDSATVSKAAYRMYTNAIIDTIKIIENNGGSMAINFNIQRNEETGEWEFNFGSGVSDAVLATRERQWRSNNYLPYGTKNHTYDTAEQCIAALKKKFFVATPDDLEHPDPDVDYSQYRIVDEATMCKVMAIYCEMQMNVFNSQPIVISKDVRYETVIEVETKSMMLAGMAIEVGTKRVYPRSTLASQVIGYTGAITSQSSWNNVYQPKGYSYNDTVGKDGIEYSMEDWLTQNSSAKKGARVVERDQRSTIVREISYTEPKDGDNVKLTMIASYQQEAERAIADNVNHTRDIQDQKCVSGDWLENNKAAISNRDWEKYPLALATHGTLIVLDMKARVLACANYPTYDLNALVAGGQTAISILADERNLLLNYAIQARATPGSIFKMVTSYGALNEGLLDPQEYITDMGYYTRYNADLNTAPKCWISASQRDQHQNQTIVEGLEHSCNFFFYELGHRLGEERLYRYASLLGLTSKTGIDLPGEVRSVVGCQNTLYDPTKDMSEASQDTSLPIIVFNAIKKHLKNCGASRNIEYDDERLSVCAKRLMDMAVNYNESDWLDNMRTILMEELSMTKSMVYTASIITDTYNYMNTVKWGGGQTILTAIGQSVTVLTPIAVARYVCAIANGGSVYNVSLVDSIISPDGEILSQREPQKITDLENADVWFPYIWRGMNGVTDEGGTAATYFRSWSYKPKEVLAAKTGSAEVTQIDLENNAWFVAFAPYENPEIAVVVFIPNGYSGSRSAQSARDFIGWYLDQKELRTTDYTLPSGNTLAP